MQNLFYAMLAVEYICDSSYQVRRKELKSLALFYLMSGEMELKYQEKPIPPGQTTCFSWIFPILMPTKP